jgi:hypothetical protein
MSNQTPNAYSIRLEVLKEATGLVKDTWYQKCDVLRTNAENNNEPITLPPEPTTKDILVTASQLYDFVQNHGKHS